MDAPVATILQSILRRLSRSLLQYARDAFPWTNPNDQERLDAVRKLIDEEEKGAVRLAAFLRRRRIPLPYIGPYPQNFTNLNYVSFDHLLPDLLAYEKTEIVEVERDAAKLWDDLQARDEAQKILDMLRRHAQVLEQLMAKAPLAA